jgi:anaerobic ribonucleoside-triphosphate reductase activating protein
MLKYVDTAVTFAEFPNEVSLCINISGCPCFCDGCHSPYLSKDIGEVLSLERLQGLIESNKGITLVGFMGGDSDPKEINKLAKWVRENYPELHIGWYSGKQELADSVIDIDNFNVIKLGGYNKLLGPLNYPTTNQRFYRIINSKMYDYTYLFWKNSTIEIWRDIEGFKGYQVSNLGNVRSLNYRKTNKIQNLKLYLSGPNRGYKSVSMQVGDKVIRRNVHRLVAIAFIPNPQNLPEINHIDENGLNNNISNLEWCDRRYNLAWGTRMQRFVKAKSIPILQYDLSGNFIKEWESQAEVCRQLKLDSGSLSHCLHGYRIKKGKSYPVHSYHGFKWKYKN